MKIIFVYTGSCWLNVVTVRIVRIWPRLCTKPGKNIFLKGEYLIKYKKRELVAVDLRSKSIAVK
jgi:hypothetical protein